MWILTAIMSLSSAVLAGGCKKGKTEFYLLKDTTASQMMGIVIITPDKKTIVIDGGTRGDSEQLMNFLRQKSSSHVDAWFFTHPHQDHLGAFSYIFQYYMEEITVDKIYHHFPSYEELMEYEYRTNDEKRVWQTTERLFENEFKNKVQVVQANDVFQIGEIKITVLKVYDPQMTNNFINNSSVVYRVENENTSFLILGDLGEEAGNELMQTCPLELLQADYTQMAHHGQAGVSKAFYEYIKPKRCIWPTPEWLWNNDNGEGFDTGPWLTVRTREWMEELGVTEHIISKDGVQLIKF